MDNAPLGTSGSLTASQLSIDTVAIMLLWTAFGMNKLDANRTRMLHLNLVKIYQSG